MSEAFHGARYERLQSDDDDDENEDLPPQVHVTAPGGEGNGKNGRWNHIENLDEFFIRYLGTREDIRWLMLHRVTFEPTISKVYKPLRSALSWVLKFVYNYHQQNGFVCILLKECLELAQYIFIVLFTSFLILCVDYEKLFRDKDPVLIDCIYFTEARNMNGFMIMFLLIAFLFWFVQMVRVILNFFKLLEIRSFYKEALRVSEQKLSNMQWQDVQLRLINVQKEHQMCVHKAELSELDIYHRILRWKNYLIAMQNKEVLPCVYHFPIIGKRAFLTEGMKYNLRLILFWGPDSPFQDTWKLKPEYKSAANRQALAGRLSRRILWLGLFNFALLPFIFLWQVLYSFFSYAEMVKRSPGAFGARRWSYYGRLFLRHFNELDHEFQIRLSKAYEPACEYMNIFTSPLLAIISKNIAFVAGSFLAVLMCLSIYDQDVFRAEHMLTAIASLGLIIRVCYAFIPDEHLVWCPEQKLKQVLTHVHYMPDKWKTKAHTNEVFLEFQQLFEYKAVFVFQELVSALVTPFLLCFNIRYKALDIVDFFRNFTVEVVGVGDVCSFAQMDVRKHGNPDWMSRGLTGANQYEQAENGKTELSLLQFSIKNPHWKAPQPQAQFMSTIKESALKDSYPSLQSSFAEAGSKNEDVPASSGLPSLTPLGAVPTQSLVSTRHNTVDATPVEERLKMEEEMNSSMLYMHELHERGASLGTFDEPSGSGQETRTDVVDVDSSQSRTQGPV